ncbi:MAG TPA: 30S ribosomal protein S12 methylthiotransferase RimO [Defluviitoga sp.]|nr:30S ribosomal protein S12 methylthiotransferase RimO [Defluviitoga sp.]HOP24849.1 30S ribosomal protein S12 methylthiotransferase RimO [Defluviitoga sp.]HPZ28241.1 30S ribosomal protein S12 methylthiotransferase RimO [Defluviitoga sp.]HQD62131.1 30S ribosomal protein S12 methylthiotransferase RimO [Defluviitoga sp.]
MNKFHIVRLGCPKNDADADILQGILENKGYRYTPDPINANYIFINTCGFIEDAKKESIEAIFEYLLLKDEKKDIKVIPFGCLAERYYTEILEEIPEVDGLYGVLSPQTIVDKLESEIFTYKATEPETTYECQIRSKPREYYAYVKIGDGCNRNCTFCSIPFFKGKPKSREILDIKNEVEFLVNNGVKEIILVSQDNCLYGVDNYKKQALPELLKTLNNIKGDFRIRVLYLHPDFLNKNIIEVIHYTDKVLKYFDVPIQHISTKILTLMGRIKKKKDLIELIEQIRKQPSVIRTTLMVGFPGETEKDFQELLNFVHDAKFERLGSFIYSQEEDTLSFNMPNQVDEKTKIARQEALMKIQQEISKDVMQSFLGYILKVLIEEKEDDIYIGRSYLDAPEIDGNIFFRSKKKLKLGEFINVKITGSYEYDLEGEVAENEYSQFIESL